MISVKKLATDVNIDLWNIHDMYEAIYEHDSEHVYVVHDDTSALTILGLTHHTSKSKPRVVFGAALKTKRIDHRIHVAKIPSEDYFMHQLSGENETTDYFEFCEETNQYRYKVSRLPCSNYEFRFFKPIPFFNSIQMQHKKTNRELYQRTAMQHVYLKIKSLSKSTWPWHIS
jgi:hypothetical protein